MSLEIGKTYNLRHQRFGAAAVKVLRVEGEWIEVEVVSGVLQGRLGEWGPGDVKTLRESHCAFAPLKGGAS